MRFRYFVKTCVAVFFLCLSCNKQSKSHLFSRLDKADTHIDFSNKLFEDDQMNALNYSYFYNGGGVSVGDINNDGLTDIFFTGNMVKNRLYLNKGNFEFENITDKSGVANKQGWCTGSTMVDINGDGKLDIYICRSADGDPARRKNLLFINNGDLTFTEKAEEYGLANEGYSTQASFFDYDKDGDLDMFLINHSLQKYANGTIENPGWRKQRQEAFECKLYRNNWNETLRHSVYTDVSNSAGITSNVMTFGLGLAISDLNNDGWPDIYISNDFNEADYLFINNGPVSLTSDTTKKEVTFSERLHDCMDEVSLYSMGSDAADFNNDGLIDIVTMDMLPADGYTQKMHQGAENFDKFQQLFKLGFYYQYSRNMLQKNNGDGTFSEIGQLAGVSNTDWSWSALFCDFDNDGRKDLLASTGYVKDYTDMDFIKYTVDLAIKSRAGEKIESVKEVIDKMPVNHLVSTVFQNNGSGGFKKITEEWGIDQKTVAAGAAYADLNNDGKMDIVISNTNDYAGVYRNNGESGNKNNFLRIKLEGDRKNPDGIGSKIKLYCKGQQLYQEQFPVRGYQSSVDPVLNFGLGKNDVIDSLLIIWPNDQYQLLQNIKPGQLLKLDIKNASGKWIYESKKMPSLFALDSSINHTHIENDFNDFTVQTLLPNYLSRQGPCMAKADINKDGLEDLFIGGAKGQPGSLFFQAKSGVFVLSHQVDIASDSLSEDNGSAFFDANGDGYADLYVASGGYEFAENDLLLQDRLYLNDGRGHFLKSKKALPFLLSSKGCIAVADADGDKDLDVFVGGRVVPGKYPSAPTSYLLLNDGRGNFTDATVSMAPALQHIGMITDAVWTDLNKDGANDLIIVGEWMPVKVFINKNGKLEDASAQYIRFASSGWWNKIVMDDFDGDGDVDFVLGNVGTNAQFKPTDKEPMSLYYKDFDGNGSIDPIFCYYINGTSYPSATRDDLVEQLPMLKRKFNDYKTYASATINDIFSVEQLKDAGKLTAEITSTIYLQNNGDAGFEVKSLPQEAQYAPVYAIASIDANHDGKKDIIIAGNNAWTRIKFGRFRANHGMVLLGNGKGDFTYLPQIKSGLNIRNDIRSMEMIKTAKGNLLLAGANDGKLISYKLNE